MKHTSISFLLLVLLAITGCGTSTSSKKKKPTKPKQIELLLDFTPNAAHAGIYAMQAEKIDQKHGILTKIRVPGSSNDSVKLLIAGQVDAAVLDIHDLAIARDHGKAIVGIAPVVQQPLASLLTQPEIKSPRELAGKRVGVSGLPSDEAVLNSILRGAGVDPATVKKTTVGFNAVNALLGRKVQGATAFWNVEGLALQAKRKGSKVFKVDEFGAPSYPELVLSMSERKLRANPKMASSLQQSLREGYQLVSQNPETGVRALTQGARGLDKGEVQQQLQAILPAFRSKTNQYATFHKAVLTEWARWEKQFGIVKSQPIVDRTFSFEVK